ncbi:hypothetical protein EsH8_II_001545 [Colletotrichum jinshuiense]
MSFFQRNSKRQERSDPKTDPEKKKPDGRTTPTPTSTSTPPARFLHEQVMQERYHDPLKLKASLDSIYGEGNYQVKERANRYILQLPIPIKEGDMAKIEKRIRSHYND